MIFKETWTRADSGVRSPGGYEDEPGIEEGSTFGSLLLAISTQSLVAERSCDECSQVLLSFCSDGSCRYISCPAS